MDLHVVYQIRCPYSHQIKYVGMSKRVDGRIYEHQQANVKSTKEWIQQLKIENSNPIFEIVQENLSKEEARILEKALTELHKDTVLNIYVVNNPPPSIVEHMSKCQQGKPKSEATKAKMKEAWKTRSKDNLFKKKFNEDFGDNE